MRNLAFFVQLILLSSNSYLIFAQTQHAISLERNAYRAQNFITKQQVEYKDPGIMGRGLTWDFSQINPIYENYNLNYFIPDSTQTNRLCGQEHNTRYYYLQNNDSLWATGFENATTFMQYNCPELKLRFPFNYGDTLYSNFVGEGEYCHSISINIKGYTRVMADAEGDIILPNQHVRKALRVRTLRHYTETGKDRMEMTLDSYAWYARGIRYPVFESIKTVLTHNSVTEDYKGESLKDTTVFQTSFYFPPELQMSQVQTDLLPKDLNNCSEDISNVFTEARLMPNPISTNLNITYKLTRPARVWFSIHNISGVPQYDSTPENQSEGNHVNSIDTSMFPIGTYLLYVHVDDMLLKQVVIKI